MDFLGRIRKLDSSLQRGLDNGFARVFGGKVVPNELEECLKQEIEDFLMQDANGRFLAPNDFRIGISPVDFEHLGEAEPGLPGDLADRMSRYCRNNGWALSGPVSVRLELVSSLHTGQLKTASQFTSGNRIESGYVGDRAEPRTDPDGPRAEDGRPAPDARGTSAVEVPPPAARFDPAAAGAAAGDDDGDWRERAWADAEFAPAGGAPTEAAAAPPAQVTLLLQDGSNRTHAVRRGSTIIGRGTACDFRLPDTGVSRQHAEITWDGRDAVLVDLRSTNGTLVNDTPVENWLLADGDVISMGHSVIEVRIG